MGLERKLLPLVMGLGAAGAVTACGDKGSGPDTRTTPTPGSPTALPTAKQPILVTSGQQVPMELGGAVAPRPPEPPPVTGSASPGGAPSPGAALAPQPGAAAPAAAEEPAVGRAAAAPASPPASPPAIAIVHHHAPGEACTPLSQADIDRAFQDLHAP